MLVNHYPDCEPSAAKRKDEGFYNYDYKTAGRGCPQSFEDYAYNLAGRYRNNATIAFWQLVNEAESAWSGACNTTIEANGHRRAAGESPLVGGGTNAEPSAQSYLGEVAQAKHLRQVLAVGEDEADAKRMRVAGEQRHGAQPRALRDRFLALVKRLGWAQRSQVRIDQLELRALCATRLDHRRDVADVLESNPHRHDHVVIVEQAAVGRAGHDRQSIDEVLLPVGTRPAAESRDRAREILR